MKPLESFKHRIEQFARSEKRGIRNPFVIVTTSPKLEHKVGEKANEWSKSEDSLEIKDVRIDKLFPKTESFKISSQLAEAISSEDIRQTLEDNLKEQLVKEIKKDVGDEFVKNKENVITLTNLGSVNPFARASGILDEMDRKNFKCAIGVIYPGEVIAGKLSMYGGKSRHYYPAHIIREQITEDEINE